MVESEEEKTLPEAQRTQAIELVKVDFIYPSLSALGAPLSQFVPNFNGIFACNKLVE